MHLMSPLLQLLEQLLIVLLVVNPLRRAITIFLWLASDLDQLDRRLILLIEAHSLNLLIVNCPQRRWTLYILYRWLRHCRRRHDTSIGSQQFIIILCNSTEFTHMWFLLPLLGDWAFGGRGASVAPLGRGLWLHLYYLLSLRLLRLLGLRLVVGDCVLKRTLGQGVTLWVRLLNGVSGLFHGVSGLWGWRGVLCIVLGLWCWVVLWNFGLLIWYGGWFQDWLF